MNCSPAGVWALWWRHFRGIKAFNTYAIGKQQATMDEWLRNLFIHALMGMLESQPFLPQCFPVSHQLIICCIVHVITELCWHMIHFQIKSWNTLCFIHPSKMAWIRKFVEASLTMMLKQDWRPVIFIYCVFCEVQWPTSILFNSV